MFVLFGYRYATAYAKPEKDTYQGPYNLQVSSLDGESIIKFEVEKNTSQSRDIPLDGELYLLFAYGPMDVTWSDIQKHRATFVSESKFNFACGMTRFCLMI